MKMIQVLICSFSSEQKFFSANQDKTNILFIKQQRTVTISRKIYFRDLSGTSQTTYNYHISSIIPFHCSTRQVLLRAILEKIGFLLRTIVSIAGGVQFPFYHSQISTPTNVVFTFLQQGQCTTKLEKNKSYTYYYTEKLSSPQSILQKTHKQARNYLPSTV